MKTTIRYASILTGAATVMAPRMGHAHLVNTDVGEFYAGMLHPLTSVEHLLPILLLAMLASQGRQRAARWALAVFPAALMAGVVLGNALGHAQAVHLISVSAPVFLGGFLTWGRPLGLTGLLGAVGSVGLVLGYRSGVDMVNAGVAFSFIPGVGLAGFITLALGAAWVPPAVKGIGSRLVRLSGAAGLLGGIWLIIETVWTGNGPGTRGVGLPSLDALVMLARTESLSPSVAGAALLGAAGWGAAHAFTPGHGKAIVAAYLVGSRSTPRHAAYLGLTVTVTHTLGILILGVVTLLAQAYIVPEQLYPWMGAASGLIVCGLGASMFVGRLRGLREHDHVHHHGHAQHNHHADHHGHTHDHEHVHGAGHAHPGENTARSAVTWRSLLGLGISGGLLPCPAALVLLLTMISLQRVGFGLALVLAFSFGLAGVLMVVGMLFVKGGQLLDRMPASGRPLRLIPVVSSFFVAALGLSITVGAVLEIAV